MSGNGEQFGDGDRTIADDAGANDAGTIGTDQPAAKRRRGRPSRADSGGIEYVDPASLGGTAADEDGGTSGEQPARRRGRKPGSGTKSKAVPIGLETLIIALSAVQLTAFKLTEIPEVILTPEQNNNLAAALQRVSRHYPVVISEKTADHIALAVVAGNICFTQYAVYNQRMKAHRAHQ